MNDNQHQHIPFRHLGRQHLRANKENKNYLMNVCGKNRRVGESLKDIYL